MRRVTIMLLQSTKHRKSTAGRTTPRQCNSSALRYIQSVQASYLSTPKEDFSWVTQDRPIVDYESLTWTTFFHICNKIGLVWSKFLMIALGASYDDVAPLVNVCAALLRKWFIYSRFVCRTSRLPSLANSLSSLNNLTVPRANPINGRTWVL